MGEGLKFSLQNKLLDREVSGSGIEAHTSGHSRKMGALPVTPKIRGGFVPVASLEPSASMSCFGHHTSHGQSMRDKWP